MLLSLSVQGQRIDGSCTLHMEAGIADIPRGGNIPLALSLSLSYRYRQAGEFLAGVRFTRKKISYRASPVPKAGYLLEGGYQQNIVQFLEGRGSFRAGGTLWLGYESLNGGRRRLYDGARLQRASSFSMGIIPKISVEYFLSRRVLLEVNLKAPVAIKSVTGPRINPETTIAIGYIIN